MGIKEMAGFVGEEREGGGNLTLVRLPYRVSYNILILMLGNYGVKKRIAGKIGWIAKFKG